MIDKEQQLYLRNKYNPDGSVLRKAQLRMLEMLEFIDRVCSDNNITYWIDAGTLLGAVRHGGFLPWDDDSDICMPFEDAQKFKHLLLSNNYSDDFVLQCRETDEGYFGPWYILRDKKTEYLQDSYLHKKRKYRGLQVDIFIVENKSFFPFHLLSKKIQSFFIDRELHMPTNSVYVKYWVIFFYSVLHLLIPVFRFLSPKRDYMRYPYGTPWFTKLYNKNVFPLSRILFEGKMLNCPNNCNLYLFEKYGDWKQIPKEIVTHNVSIVFYN